MAASPRFKVHSPRGEYIASCKYLEDAAALVAAYGDGARIIDRRWRVLCWLEGQETQPAAESFDWVRITGESRIKERSDRQ